jgi:hypothetical protein
MSKFMKYCGKKKTKTKEKNKDNNKIHTQQPSFKVIFLVIVTIPLWVGHLLVDTCLLRIFKPVEIISIFQYWNEEKKYRKALFFGSLDAKPDDFKKFQDSIEVTAWIVGCIFILSKLF